MSLSLPAAGGLTAWSKVVIGAVALLAAGIGVAAGSFLVANRTAAIGAGAAYVPATAPFYAEVRLDPSADQDAALRELLGRFPAIEGVDLARPLYPQLGKKIDELLAAEGEEISWSADVAPWFDGRIGVAVLDVPLEAMSDEPTADEPPMPSGVVLLGVTDSSAAEAALDRISAASLNAPTFSEQQHGGVTIHVADDDGGAYALTSDQLIVAEGVDDVAAALDARADGANTLAELEDVTRLTDALPADWLAFAIYDFGDLMAAALEEAEAESTEMTEAFRSFLEAQPLRGAVAMTIGGDRVAVDVATEPPTGGLAPANAERGLAGEMPADVLYYSEAGNIGDSLAAVIGPMTDAFGATGQGTEQLETLEAALGGDLEELVSWIEDGAMAIGFDGDAPYAGLVLVPNDVDAAERRLGQLASFAGLAGLDPESGVTVEESDVSGTTVTTIRLETAGADIDPMIPAPSSFAVQYAVTDDRALIGVGESFVGTVLQLEASASLGAVERFTAAVDELGGANAAAITWLDLRGVREAIETALEPMIGMFDAEGAYESEIRPWLLPLDRVVSVSRLEGDLLMQRTALLVE